MLPFQQLFVPDPSHSKSTPGKGIPAGGEDPLLFSTLLTTLVPSGFGSMSANAPGGSPANDPSKSVLTVAMPTNLLPLTLLSSTVVWSVPTTRMPQPLGTKFSNPPPGSEKLT